MFGSRILRRRSVLAIVFLCSLVYFITSISKQVNICCAFVILCIFYTIHFIFDCHMSDFVYFISDLQRKIAVIHVFVLPVNAVATNFHILKCMTLLIQVLSHIADTGIADGCGHGTGSRTPNFKY